MGNVGFGVEFFFPVDSALNLAVSNPFDDGWNACKEIVCVFFLLKAFIEVILNSGEPFLKGLLSSERYNVSHEYPDLINLLAF